MQLSQDARVTSKLEVQDPEVHGHRKPFLPCQLHGPMVTSILRCCRVVERDVNDSREGERGGEGEGGREGEGGGEDEGVSADGDIGEESKAIETIVNTSEPCYC